MAVIVSKRFHQKWKRLHPKHRGQVAAQIVELAAKAERSDICVYHAHGTDRITVGEYRVEIKRNASCVEIIDLKKRNDDYKP